MFFTNDVEDVTSNRTEGGAYGVSGWRRERRPSGEEYTGAPVQT